LIITKSQFENVTECLANLAEKLNITAVLLVTNSGETVAQQLMGPWEHYSVLISALTANSYVASSEMARILGEEPNFKMILHEGDKNNVFVCSVNREYCLIVVFESGVPIGLVRLFTKKIIAKLLPILHQGGKTRSELEQIFDEGFQIKLTEKLNHSFVAK